MAAAATASWSRRSRRMSICWRFVVEAPTPDETDDAAEALAAKLTSETDLFKSVRRPDGGNFFKQNGLLFLSKQSVQDFADQIIAAQPLIGTLAADPSLRGVFDALDLAAQGAAQGGGRRQRDRRRLYRRRSSRQGGAERPASTTVLAEPADRPEARAERTAPLRPDAAGARLQRARAGETRHRCHPRRGARTRPHPGERRARARHRDRPPCQTRNSPRCRAGAGFSTALSIGLLCLWLLLALRSLRLVVAIVDDADRRARSPAASSRSARSARSTRSRSRSPCSSSASPSISASSSACATATSASASTTSASAVRRTVEGIGGPLAVAAAADRRRLLRLRADRLHRRVAISASSPASA